MKMKNTYKKGLTLIELIVYIGIVAIVLVALISLSTNLVYSQGKSVNSNEISQNMSLVYTNLVSSIGNAKSVTGSYPADQLALTTASGTLDYSLSGNALLVSENGGTAIPLTNSQVVVSAPSGGQIFTKVTNGNATSIKIELIFSQTSDVNNKETLQTSVLVRGK